MYWTNLLFSSVPFRKKCPHVQLTMPTSQYDRHTLHYALGSTSSSSHNSDFPFEMGIMDDLVQGWSNPRIKYIKIRHWNTTSWWRRSQFIHWINQLHFLNPLHRFRRILGTSTYLGLESYLPASKCRWRRELVKVKIRNLQSLLVCPIILWRVSSTEDDWIFGWRSGLASQILISFWSSTFLRCGWMGRFLNCCLPWIQFLRKRSWWRSLWMCKNVSWCNGCIPGIWRLLILSLKYEGWLQ